MNRSVLISLILFLSFYRAAFGQEHSHIFHPDTTGYNYAYWNAVADRKHYSVEERAEYIAWQKRLYIENQYKQFRESDLVWTEPYVLNTKGTGGNMVNAGTCTNIDFETGTTAGWTVTSGYHPNSGTNPPCCPTVGGQTLITTTGNDPFGGFPMVAPGGSFSLRLGNSATGAEADRISQKFFVTPAGANFTYQYAVVLNNLASHDASVQPQFVAELIDSLGNPLLCTTYTVVAGSGLQGYFTSPTQANNAPVIYKPWTTVAMDLTPYVNTNITIRYTVYDCSAGGHFGYVYIDGFCTNFNLAASSTVCPNTSTVFCAPSGFSITTWNGPGVVSNPNQCITALLPGVYTCTTYLVPGCPGPVFTRTLSNYANPVLNFTPVTLGACAHQYTFNSSSSISVGLITGYNWTFGTLGVSALQNPLFNFPAAGNYPVKFRVTSNQNCKDSVTQNVIIYPLPNISFSPPSYCINTPVQFTNTSTIPVVAGVPPSIITSYTWNMGNGQFSNLSAPLITYTTSGTFNVNLIVTTSQGCTATATQTLGIFPPPVLNFTAAPLCDVFGTTFAPSTSTAIASGSIVSYQWNFGDGQTSNQVNPTHIYALPGTYTVFYTGTSNHNCVTTVSNVVGISPTPSISFNTFSVNACTTTFTFVNTSTISSGAVSYTWNFGGGNTSNAYQPPVHNFPGPGNYTVVLIGKSLLGCADTAKHQFSLYPFPAVTFSVPSSCENALFTCTVTAPTGSVSSYLWDFGDGSPTSGAQNPTHVYNATGSYSINLTVTSNLNCISNFSNVINVWPNPTASFTYFPSDACTPNYTLINGSVVTPTVLNSIASNLWNFGASTSTAYAPVQQFPGPGNYTINLITTTNRGCKDTIEHYITIYSYPVVSFSTLPSCMNVPSVFIPTFSVPPVPVTGTVTTYVWSFGDGNTQFGGTIPAVYSYSASGTYPATFSVTSNMGCVRSASLNVIVYPVPVISYTFNPICAGSPITFTNSSTVSAPGNIIAWKWDFENDGVTNSNALNPVTTYSTSGIYTVELHARTTFNCMDSLLHTLVVNPNPISIFSASSECLRKSTVFTNSSVPSTDPSTLTTIVNSLWSFGDGSPLSTNPVPIPHIYNSATTYTVSLMVTNALNCSNTSTALVTVHPLPNVFFNVNEACLGRATQFIGNFNIPGPSSIVQWKWDFQNDGTWDDITNVNPVFTYTASGSYNCQLIAISNNGCDSAITKNIVVHANPIANFISPTICHQHTVSFSNLSGSTDGAITSYKWDFNGDNITDAIIDNPVTTFTTSGVTIVHLIVSTQFNCSDTMSKTLFINPKPVPAFGSENKSGCPKLCVDFENSSFISTGSISVTEWNFGDGTILSNIQNPSHCFGTGNYDVTIRLTSDSGCVTSLTQPGFVTVYPLPSAAFRVEPEEVDEDEPTIKVYSAASGAAFTQYYINDGSSYSGANFEHTFQEIKDQLPMVVQIVKSENGCMDTTYNVLKIKPAFAIYFPNTFTPNDDGNNDTYQPKGVGIKEFDLWIYDRWGHLLFHTDDIYRQWDGTVKGSRDPIKQDVYIWKAKVMDIFNKAHEYVGHVSLIK